MELEPSNSKSRSLVSRLTLGLRPHISSEEVWKGYRESRVEMRRSFDQLFRDFYPEGFKQFQRPDALKVSRSVDAVLGRDARTRRREFIEARPDAYAKALLVIEMIRYVDDFIDTALLPSLKKNPRSELVSSFDRFLQKALALAKRYDPNVPEEIIDLPRSEMAMLLNGSQEYFDANIVTFLSRKSLDLDYASSLFSGKLFSKGDENEQLQYLGNCVRDILRDFEDHMITKDFNVSTHISRNKLNSDVLLHFLADHKKRIAAAVSDDGYQESKRKMDLQSCVALIDHLRQFASKPTSLRQV